MAVSSSESEGAEVENDKIQLIVSKMLATDELMSSSSESGAEEENQVKGRKAEEMSIQDNFKEVQMQLQENSPKETVDQKMIQDEDSYSEIKKEDR